MTDRELMQQALEALELHAKQYPHMQKGYTVDAITALRERLAQPVFHLRSHGDVSAEELDRLAQPVQEPVAWGVFDGPNLHDVNFTEEDAQEMVRLKGDGSVVKPLYTSPQPQMQPCAGRNCGSTNPNLHSAECFEEYEKTTGMRRKPLSEEEILTYKHMIDWTAEWSYIKFARAIEAAHGIKGEA